MKLTSLTFPFAVLAYDIEFESANLSRSAIRQSDIKFGDKSCHEILPSTGFLSVSSHFNPQKITISETEKDQPPPPFIAFYIHNGDIADDDEIPCSIDSLASIIHLEPSIKGGRGQQEYKLGPESNYASALERMRDATGRWRPEKWRYWRGIQWRGIHSELTEGLFPGDGFQKVVRRGWELIINAVTVPLDAAGLEQEGPNLDTNPFDPINIDDRFMVGNWDQHQEGGFELPFNTPFDLFADTQPGMGSLPRNLDGVLMGFPLPQDRTRKLDIDALPGLGIQYDEDTYERGLGFDPAPTNVQGLRPGMHQNEIDLDNKLSAFQNQYPPDGQNHDLVQQTSNPEFLDKRNGA